MPELRRIGSSGMATPPLVLGGNVFGWTIDEATSFAVLDAFVAGGGAMIDTADMYSSWIPGNRGGESEEIIGAWLKRRGRRDDVIVATKIGSHEIDGVKGLGRAHVERATEDCLRRLGVDCIDMLYVHRDDLVTPLDEVAETLDGLVRAGKVRTLAASNYTADRLAAALDAQDKIGGAHFVALQPLYSLVERTEYEGALQQVCIDRDIAVLPYYSLAAGFLTGKYRSKDDLGGARDHTVGKYVEQRQGVLTAMDGVAEETGASLAQIALAWLAAQPGVTAPIASATSVKQAEDLIAAMALTLTPDQIARLDAASAPAEVDA